MSVDPTPPSLSGRTTGGTTTGGTATGAPVPPGWYPDPWNQAPWRWWDGVEWTGYAGPVAAPVAPRRSWYPRRGERDETTEMRGGGIAVIGVITAIALAIGGELATRAAGVDEDSIWNLVVAQVGLWTGLLGACLLAVRRHGDGSLRRLGWSRLNGRDLWVGATAGVAARMGSVIIVLPFLPLLRNETEQRETTYTNPLLDQNGYAVLIAIVIVVIGAPLVEELFFRGLVQSTLTRRFGPIVAIWVQGLLFGTVHYTIAMSAVQAAVTFVAIGATGVFLGILRWRFQRLGPGIVAHAVFNVIAVGLVYALN